MNKNKDAQNREKNQENNKRESDYDPQAPCFYHANAHEAIKVA
jgi:hypothetical protein